MSAGCGRWAGAIVSSRARWGEAGEATIQVRVVAIFRAAWQICWRVWPVALALCWLCALSWVLAQRPHADLRVANRLHRVVTTPAGFLTVMGRGWPGRVVSQLGRFVEAGAMPIPVPPLEGLIGAGGNGVTLREHGLSLLVVRPLWFVLIYSAFVVWLAWRLQGLEGEESSVGLLRAWLRVAYVGAWWLVLVQAARLAAMMLVQRYGDLGSPAPRAWLQPTCAWVLAGLHLAAALAMGVSAQRGGMFRGSARALGEVVARRVKDLGGVLVVGGALVLFGDWVIRTTELTYWPSNRSLGGATGLGLIWARAMLGVWALIALLMVLGHRPVEDYLGIQAPQSTEPVPGKRSRGRRKR